VRVVPVRGSSSPLSVEIDRVDSPRISERHVLKARLEISEQAGVTIDWHTPHLVVITLSDGESQQIEVPWTIENVVAASSTGEMEINPIVLGTLKR
jgi:hypothetical protein